MNGRSTESIVFFFNATATTEIYTLSLHDALPISLQDADSRLDELRIRQDWLMRLIHVRLAFLPASPLPTPLPVRPWLSRQPVAPSTRILARAQSAARYARRRLLASNRTSSARSYSRRWRVCPFRQRARPSAHLQSYSPRQRAGILVGSPSVSRDTPFQNAPAFIAIGRQDGLLGAK